MHKIPSLHLAYLSNFLFHFMNDSVDRDLSDSSNGSEGGSPMSGVQLLNNSNDSKCDDASHFTLNLSQPDSPFKECNSSVVGANQKEYDEVKKDIFPDEDEGTQNTEEATATDTNGSDDGNQETVSSAMSEQPASDENCKYANYYCKSVQWW